MDTSKINSTAVGMLIGGLIVGFLIGWFWHKQTVNESYGTGEYTEEDATTTDSTSTPTAGTGSSVGSSGQANVGSSMTYYGSKDKTVEAHGEISVSDQKAGKSVMISKVQIDDFTTGWVAIRDDVKGLMGNVLGAQRFSKGTVNNVSISLLRATEKGKTYHVVLYKDNGDMTFSKTGDMVVTHDGSIVAKTFKAQ